MLSWAAVGSEEKCPEPWLSRYSKELLPGNQGDGRYLGVEDIAGNPAEH